jgi:hypothetical protein
MSLLAWHIFTRTSQAWHIFSKDIAKGRRKPDFFVDKAVLLRNLLEKPVQERKDDMTCSNVRWADSMAIL